MTSVNISAAQDALGDDQGKYTFLIFDDLSTLH
jgi:hypothetical protein